MISIRFVVVAGLLSLTSAARHSTSTSSTKITSHYSTSATSTKTTSSTPTTTSSTPTTTSTPPPVATVAQYGQCGGIGFTGGTVCTTDWICMVSNEFFSQCLPGPNYTAPTITYVAPTTTYTPPPVQTMYYAFSFGDSYTETRFDLAGTKPAVGNQLGNPAWPGLTTAGGPNWVGDLLIDNPQLLSYNFGSDGATIDATLVAPKIPTAQSFVDQVAEFTSNLVPAPDYAPWVPNNTFFAIWMGNTDVFLAYNSSDWSTISQSLIDTYMEQVEILYNAGGQTFLFLMVPPLQYSPAMLESAADQNALGAAIDNFNTLLNDAAGAFIDAKFGGIQFPRADWGGFGQVVDTPLAFEFMVDNPTAYGAPNASCYNPDGVSCLWTDEYNIGQELQSLVSVYCAEIVGVADYQ